MDIVKFYDVFLEVGSIQDGFEKQQDHYKGYEKLQSDVQAKRGISLDKDKDYEFLKQLIFEHYNCIATIGKGELANETQFKDIIKQPAALKAVENLINNPSPKSGEDLAVAILKTSPQKPQINRYMVVNRVLAACTTEVSSLVSRVRFSLIFNLLIKKGVIDDYNGKSVCSTREGKGNVEERADWEKEMKIEEWYKENKHLMECLRKVITHKTNAEINDIHLANFPWFLWTIIGKEALLASR